MFPFFTFFGIKPDLLVHFLSFAKVAEVRKQQWHLLLLADHVMAVSVLQCVLEQLQLSLTVIVIKLEPVLMIQQNDN